MQGRHAVRFIGAPQALHGRYTAKGNPHGERHSSATMRRHAFLVAVSTRSHSTGEDASRGSGADSAYLWSLRSWLEDFRRNFDSAIDRIKALETRRTDLELHVTGTQQTVGDLSLRVEALGKNISELSVRIEKEEGSALRCVSEVRRGAEQAIEALTRVSRMGNQETTAERCETPLPAPAAAAGATSRPTLKNVCVDVINGSCDWDEGEAKFVRGSLHWALLIHNGHFQSAAGRVVRQCERRWPTGSRQRWHLCWGDQVSSALEREHDSWINLVVKSDGYEADIPFLLQRQAQLPSHV